MMSISTTSARNGRRAKVRRSSKGWSTSSSITTNKAMASAPTPMMLESSTDRNIPVTATAIGTAQCTEATGRGAGGSGPAVLPADGDNRGVGSVRTGAAS
jgi:hypothetical protein